MNCALLVHDIYSAFSNRKYPGDNEIVHCEYDVRWGGTLKGPCWEYSEVVDYFKGKRNRRLAAHKLRGISFGLFSLSPLAFLFWLPSFLAAAVRNLAKPTWFLKVLSFGFAHLRPQKKHDGRRTDYPCFLTEKSM